MREFDVTFDVVEVDPHGAGQRVDAFGEDERPGLDGGGVGQAIGADDRRRGGGGGAADLLAHVGVEVAQLDHVGAVLLGGEGRGAHGRQQLAHVAGPAQPQAALDHVDLGRAPRRRPREHARDVKADLLAPLDQRRQLELGGAEAKVQVLAQPAVADRLAQVVPHQHTQARVVALAQGQQGALAGEVEHVEGVEDERAAPGLLGRREQL